MEGPKPTSRSLIWITAWKTLATYDVITRELTVIGDMGVEMFDIAMSPFGHLYGVDSTGSNLYQINRVTAKATLVGPIRAQGFMNALTFGPYGLLYGTLGSQLISIDLETVEVSVLGDIGYSSAGDLAFYNNNLYMSSSDLKLILIDVVVPANSSVVGPLRLTYGLATVYVKSGPIWSEHLYGVSGNSFEVYEINPNTAALSHLTEIAVFGNGEVIDGATSWQFEL